jgi:D-sedoheptulose 7-phosphate isomerase
MTEPERELTLTALAEKEKLLLSAKNDYPDKLAELAKMMTDAISAGGKILVCGNGGSAAEGQHFAAEMVVRLTEKTARAALPAIALSADTSVLTACANDYGYDRIFARQVEAFGRKGDVLLALSTSGNSANVNVAVSAAKDVQMVTVALIGKGGGELAKLVDYSIIVPSHSVLRVQEEHLFLLHQLVDLVQTNLSPEV